MIIAVAIVAAAILLILLVAGMKPNDFTVERSIAVQAPAEKIFPLINDFHNWMQWSPWEALDPALQRTYSGNPSGVGSKYAWHGNKKVGSGAMEVTSASAPHQVVIKLDFITPFEAHNITNFTVTPAGGGASITWTMKGTSPFALKVMDIFMPMDRMVGKDFEKGLAALKTIAEK
jgi:hypothetical protein